MGTSHLHGHNVEATVYRGLCEVVDGHYHPSFLIVFIDRARDFSSMVIDILELGSDHYHECELSEQDASDFFEEGELTIFCNEEKGHKHKLHFAAEHKQGLTIDPFDLIASALEEELEQELAEGEEGDEEEGQEP